MTICDMRDFLRKKGTFNEVSNVYTYLNETRKKYGFEGDSKIIFNLEETKDNIGVTKTSLPSPHYWIEGSESLKDTDEFERWRRALMSGKLDLGEIIASCNFSFQFQTIDKSKLQSMFDEFDTKFVDLRTSGWINTNQGDNALYHADYDCTVAMLPIKNLPDNLKEGRRNLIFRKAQIRRAGMLIWELPIFAFLPYSKANEMELDKILGRMEESRELLLGTHPSRFKDDIHRHTENLYDLFCIPLEARKYGFMLDVSY